MSTLILNPLNHFITTYVAIVAHKEAQAAVWEKIPCSEWLESMIDQWEVVSKKYPPLSPTCIEIQKLVAEIETFMDNLDSYLIGNSYSTCYIKTVQGTAKWQSIMQKAKVISNSSIFGNHGLFNSPLETNR